MRSQVVTLSHVIDARAERNPGHLAMRFMDETLSYAELAKRSNALAHTLVAAGVKRGDRVGIYMDKSIHVPVALYGIMKAGGVYVPLNPAAPAARISEIIDDCGIRHLITAKNKRRQLKQIVTENPGMDCLIGLEQQEELAVNTLTWDDVNQAPSDRAPDTRIIGSDLAYIIYTSGSTGKPKGIIHTHASGLAFARWAATEYGLSENDRLGNHAPLHFDLSIFDYFAGAMAGAATVIIPEDYTKIPASYSRLIAEQGITVLFTVPFALIQLLLHGVLDERDLRALRWIIFGGEPFPVKHLRALMAKLPDVKFDNMYGPAEVNGCTHYTVPALGDKVEAIPIGPICAIAEALIVDEADEPVIPGEPGELLVRTPTMMQGYWARPDLNQKAFYHRTIVGNCAQVFYRTGDIMEQRPDGAFLFLGRKDRQIKVRGYRVELDEIEAVLAGYEFVEEAAAFSIPDKEGSQMIEAAATLKQGADVSRADLVKYLKTRLAAYSRPTRLTILGGFPRTTTGKIDRRALQLQAMSNQSDTADNVFSRTGA